MNGSRMTNPPPSIIRADTTAVRRLAEYLTVAAHTADAKREAQ